jgi:TetR/AcrR family transcriptional regulator, cholesterol catabolism regulator
MEETRVRILETAIELAEKGGFEGMRLRDVAAHADIALGTLYKRFRSKEEILIAALELEAEKLEKRVSSKPIEGKDEAERIVNFFDAASRAIFRKPNLGRAILRALTSGDEELTASVASFHQRITNMITAAMRGTKPGEVTPTEKESVVAFILQQIWFAALVGWMGGLNSRGAVTDQIRVVLEILLRGVQAT